MPIIVWSDFGSQEPTTNGSLEYSLSTLNPEGWDVDATSSVVSDTTMTYLMSQSQYDKIFNRVRILPLFYFYFGFGVFNICKILVTYHSGYSLSLSLCLQYSKYGLGGMTISLALSRQVDAIVRFSILPMLIVGTICALVPMLDDDAVTQVISLSLSHSLICSPLLVCYICDSQYFPSVLYL